MEYISRNRGIRWRKCGFFFFLLALLSFSVLGQEKRPLIREKGFIIGIGQGIDSSNVPEGYYNPIFFIGHIGLDVSKRRAWQNPSTGIFTLYLEPQINPVWIKGKDRTDKAIEFGVNVGFKHMFRLLPKLYTFISIGVGPHFTSVHTSKQRRGFLFSDNLGTGLYYYIFKDWAIQFTFRLRHLSNGDTMKPNMGINTFNYHIGISKVLK